MSFSRTMGMTAGALLGGISAAAAYGSVAKSSQMFGPSVYRGPGDRKSIALTFDDGPSESTPDLLEYLEREGVIATFFQCGMHVKRLPHVAGQVAAAGHELEITPIRIRGCRLNRASLFTGNSARPRT